MDALIKENIAKNVLILLLLAAVCAFLPNMMGDVLGSDKAAAGSMLTTISLISVIACFGCFAFTYEKVKMEDTKQRFLAHLTTGLLMFAIGITLALTSFVTKIVAGQLFIIDLLLVLVYAACVCYDFWDLLRTAN
ncbi:hypothetical protein JW721_04200 [Candidatus Micrarchaeota archaeon]|nr:hypothetical protein [Candidatus Micrarchaeota archaeon]